MNKLSIILFRLLLNEYTNKYCYMLIVNLLLSYNQIKLKLSHHEIHGNDIYVTQPFTLISY